MSWGKRKSFDTFVTHLLIRRYLMQGTSVAEIHKYSGVSKSVIYKLKKQL